MIKQNSSFTYRTEGGEMEITLHGDIDHHSAVGLRADLDRLLYRERPTRLDLNLSAVDFMDSSGLGLILGRYNLMQELGGRMVLLAPGERIERILHLAGIERLIEIKKDGKGKAGGAE